MISIPELPLKYTIECYYFNRLTSTWSIHTETYTFTYSHTYNIINYDIPNIIKKVEILSYPPQLY